MLPEAVERAVEAIASDRTSGAHALALRALAAYALLARRERRPEVVEALADRLAGAQPWIVAVRNAALLGRELARSGRWDALPRLQEALEAARRDVARQAESVLEDVRTAVTVSYSSDVREALVRRVRQGGDLRVYVCESRPLREGVALARDLREARIAATVVADAAGPGLVAQADLVLTGADALRRKGCLVNKIGTLGLALAAREFGVPYHALLEVLKVELEGHVPSWQPEARDPAELSTEVDALNLYFERVDLRLVGAVVSDAGVLQPARLLVRFRTLEDLVDWYGG